MTPKSHDIQCWVTSVCDTYSGHCSLLQASWFFSSPLFFETVQLFVFSISGNQMNTPNTTVLNELGRGKKVKAPPLPVAKPPPCSQDPSPCGQAPPPPTAAKPHTAKPVALHGHFLSRVHSASQLCNLVQCPLGMSFVIVPSCERMTCRSSSTVKGWFIQNSDSGFLGGSLMTDQLFMRSWKKTRRFVLIACAKAEFRLQRRISLPYQQGGCGTTASDAAQCRVCDHPDLRSKPLRKSCFTTQHTRAVSLSPFVWWRRAGILQASRLAV